MGREREERSSAACVGVIIAVAIIIGAKAEKIFFI